MKKRSAGFTFSAIALVAALGAVATPAVVTAQESSLSANVGLVSDYRFRGISQNYKRPALQGGVDYSHASGAYIGTWASMVDDDFLADTHGIEVDIYGGFKFPLGAGWTGDVGVLQYIYPGESWWNTTELYAAASWEWFSVKYSHSVSKKTFGYDDSRGSGYLEVNAAYPLANGLTLKGHLGFSSFKNKSANGALDYTDYRVGVAYDWVGFTWEAAVVGTDEDFRFKNKDLGKAGLLLSVSKTF